MMKLKKLVVMVLSVILAFGVMGTFTACGDDTDKNGLKVFTMFGGDDPLKVPFTQGMDKFKKDHPECKVNDISMQAVGEGFDDKATTLFVNEKEAPDVLYVFSPGRNLAIQDKLAKVSDIRSKHSDYGVGFPEVAGDPQALAFLGNTFGMFYKTDPKVFEDSDFATYESLKTKLTAMESAQIVDPIGELNTWFNYVALQKMGKKWADVKIPTKEWLTANKTDMIAVLTELKSYMTDLGLCQNIASDYGAEKAAFWKLEKSFDVNGNWNAGGFLPENTGTKENPGPDNTGKVKFRNFSITDNTATTDIDESKYVMAGFFHGWMISKNAYNNPTKLKLAVDFINAQCANVLAYGGLPANGSYASDVNILKKQTMDVLKTPGAIMCSPIDDKWNNPTAKTTFYNGLKSFVGGTKTADAVLTETIAAFAE